MRKNVNPKARKKVHKIAAVQLTNQTKRKNNIKSKKINVIDFTDYCAEWSDRADSQLILLMKC